MYKKILEKNPYQLIATAAFVDLHSVCLLGMVYFSITSRWLMVDIKRCAIALCNPGPMERQDLHNAVGLDAHLALRHRRLGPHY